MNILKYFMCASLFSIQALAATVPVVTSVTPNVGPTTGGIMPTVTVNGSGFTGASAVTFGTLAAASFTVESDSMIVVSSAALPGQATSIVHVTVTNADGTSASTSHDYYTYDDSATGYIARSGIVFGPSASDILPVNLSTAIEGSDILLPAGSNPFAMAITPDQKYGYVACSNGNVQVVDLATSALTEISLPNGRVIAITPDGQFAYVIDNNGTLHSIRISDNAVDTQPNFPLALNVNQFPAIAITTDSKLAYVTGINSTDVLIIDLATGTLVNTVTLSVAGNPTSIAMSPNGQLAYIACFIPVICVIDTVTQTEITSPGYPINTPDANGDITITPDGRFAYTAENNIPTSTTVTKIDLSNNNAITNLTLTGLVGRASLVQADPYSKTIYVTVNGNTNNQGVIPLDVATDTEAAPFLSLNGFLTDFAISVAVLTPPPPPPPPSPTTITAPQKFRGTLKSRGKRIKLSAKWKASSSSNVSAYQIYAGKKRIATVANTAKLVFKKRLKPASYFAHHIGKFKKHLYRKYRIRAVTSTGTKSSYKHLRVK